MKRQPSTVKHDKDVWLCLQRARTLYEPTQKLNGVCFAVSVQMSFEMGVWCKQHAARKAEIWVQPPSCPQWLCGIGLGIFTRGVIGRESTSSLHREATPARLTLTMGVPWPRNPDSVPIGGQSPEETGERAVPTPSM